MVNISPRYKDYLLEGNMSIPLTSSFFTIPFKHIHGSQEEEDKACSLLLKHHTVFKHSSHSFHSLAHYVSLDSLYYLCLQLNTPAPTPHCRTESLSSRNGKRNYQSTRQKLVIDTPSRYFVEYKDRL